MEPGFGLAYLRGQTNAKGLFVADPKTCTTMAQVRAEIDDLDRELVALLARRAGFIDRAAELKPGERMQARISARVEEVVANARGAAGAAGLDPDLVESLWRQLIDWSIAKEERVLGPSAPGA